MIVFKQIRLNNTKTAKCGFWSSEQQWRSLMKKPHQSHTSVSWYPFSVSYAIMVNDALPVVTALQKAAHSVTDHSDVWMHFSNQINNLCVKLSLCTWLAAYLQNHWYYNTINISTMSHMDEFISRSALLIFLPSCKFLQKSTWFKTLLFVLVKHRSPSFFCQPVLACSTFLPSSSHRGRWTRSQSTSNWNLKLTDSVSLLWATNHKQAHILSQYKCTYDNVEAH